MNELKPCPFCGEKAHMIVTAERGNPSGEMGTQARISCFNRECDAEITRWALKEEWAKESAITAWNRREQGRVKKCADIIDVTCLRLPDDICKRCDTCEFQCPMCPAYGCLKYPDGLGESEVNPDAEQDTQTPAPGTAD